VGEIDIGTSFNRQRLA
jgi:endonuclease III